MFESNDCYYQMNNNNNSSSSSKKQIFCHQYNNNQQYIPVVLQHQGERQQQQQQQQQQQYDIDDKCIAYDENEIIRKQQKQQKYIIRRYNNIFNMTLISIIICLCIILNLHTTTCYAISTSNNNDIDNNNISTLLTSTLSTLSQSSSLPPIENGPIEDALCRIEDLEQANDSQLYTILHELIQTPFFSTFHVNLDSKCPLQSWNVGSTSTKKDNNNNNNNKKIPTEKSKQSKSIFEIDNNNSNNDEDDNNDEYQCSGGADELDEEAEPLCSIAGAAEPDNNNNNNNNGFAFGTSSSNQQQPMSTFESNALYSLSKDGYKSKSQQDTFSWKDITDEIIEDYDMLNIEACDDDNDSNSTTKNNNNKKVPDTFWNDMCRNLQVNITQHKYDNNKNYIINLLLNPEHNTGYNGTHIWRAIYEENCILVDGNDSHMCLEERVLYRLLSGLHTSTTISIAKNYYPPSKRKNRIKWESNPKYFISKFTNIDNNNGIGNNNNNNNNQHNDYIRNLHFSYAVLLRALHKASKFLYKFTSNKKNIYTGNIVEDETSIILLKRLLDSSILKSCSNVFTAFDESLMFQENKSLNNNNNITNENNNNKIINDVISLQKNFKGIFHNVSSILDCVQCQQCKLHGKMAMLGYGTALKILFMDNPILDNNEIIAFINTIAKFSESIRDIRYLTQLYWLEKQTNEQEQIQQQQQVIENYDNNDQPYDKLQNNNNFVSSTPLSSASIINQNQNDNQLLSLNIVDITIGLIASLGREKLITFDRESELITLTLQRQPELLLLGKHYVNDKIKFLQLINNINSNTIMNVSLSNDLVQKNEQPLLPDAIVVGSGLAGMAATLNILDRGGNVIILEKEHLLGGNSNKASSGINACCPTNTSSTTDSMILFEQDTIKSAGESANLDLISTLISNSANAVEWLRTRVGIDLSLTSKLGGHSDKRTHRPSNGMVGAEIIYGVQKAIKAYEKTGKIHIITNAIVTNLLSDESSGKVLGVEYYKKDDNDKNIIQLKSMNVVLATGGFAADRTNGSYLDKYRPELLKMSTTAGLFSTGDGISLATKIGAGIIDMDKVQLHPTGWVDPNDPDNTSKTLAAELMRGVGGILLNNNGHRFCNELGTRSYVTDKMLSHNDMYNKTGKWDVSSSIPTFSMILSSGAASGGTKKHVDLYTRKGLMKRLEGVEELAKWMGLPKSTIVQTLELYQNDATKGNDIYGKDTFPNVPSIDLDKEVFYAGTVTPVLHYCMGGITIDTEGNVLNGETGKNIPGLYAAGEVTGGVHGVNRLGGNSLLECTVYGTIVGQKVPIQKSLNEMGQIETTNTNTKTDKKSNIITLSELEKHNKVDDCWVAIHGIVYDLTEFADEHPAGAESIHELAGTDGTAAFDAVHNEGILEDFDNDIVGILSKA